MGGECYTNLSKLFPVTLSVQIAVFRPCPGCEIQCSSVSFENVSASVDRRRKLTVGLITALVACVSLNENWEWPMPGCACKGKTRKLPNLPSISALSWPYMHVICCLQRVDTEVKPQACNICSVIVMIIICHHHITTSDCCKATGITSLSLALRYVAWYWQSTVTHSFLAAYNFWQLGQFTSAVVLVVSSGDKLPSFVGGWFFFF